MDTPNLLVAIAFLVLLIVGPRLAYVSVGRTGDVLAQLFVPPDRALGWPHGVQESDEPWGWQPAISPLGPDAPGRDDEGDAGVTVFEIVELATVRPDELIIDVGPVPPQRPHRAAA